MLSGDNSILQRATDAKEKTERQSVVEQARTDVLGYQAENKGTDLKKSQLKSVLDTYFKEVPDVEDLPDGENLFNQEFNTKDKYGTYTIRVSEIYNGNIYVDIPQSNGKIASKIFEASGTTEGKMHIGDYVNYPVYYNNVISNVNKWSSIENSVPADAYNGWRVLSINGTGNNQYIRLVSAGVPLNYYHASNSATSIENLTTRFFNTLINTTTLTDYTFYKCGFKSAQNGTIVSNISDVMALFNNVYTAKYAEGENASYTDDTLLQTFTNSNVTGQPKVQSMTKADFDAAWGTTIQQTTNLKSNDLLAIPCKSPDEDKCASIFCASAYTMNGGNLWFLGSSGKMGGVVMSGAYGVRCVVSLNSNVKYSLSEESTSTDSVKIWNIE